MIVVAGGAIAVVKFGSDGAQPRAIGGTFTLTDDATASAGCVGTGSDIQFGPGTPVILYGPSRKQLAKAKLSRGTPANGVCTYTFQFTNIPSNLATYAVGVATQPLTDMSRNDLTSNNWKFALRYGPPTTTVTGTFTLHDFASAQAGCVGQGGYSDIGQGTTVIITDQDGRILGSSALQAGTANNGDCDYSFSVPDVRQDEQQYAVEVSHRGKVVQSAAQMESDNWTFELALGG